ncbi:hypothetical protein H310_12433 [Aphanomyces invadans]|uniref:Uncharacterized protein n=1 Tax=Aphanomyces invadans TaxID=157072 RepID=A0A024TJ74_9STRA|nr:hypothetical protein H310_12433 [Aphanomyces invadans]ETV93666.1 hypothetical protein H310_12433 [Aphanomyces invadans]|eukprot:XP_008877707.1 hypothetical protein H310_12433 [Aphanomyces invadans]
MSVSQQVQAELQKLRDEIARLRQDKGQSDSLVHLLQEQNQQFSEQIFDLTAQVVAVEAEAAFKCEQNELSMQHQLKRLVSHTTFLQEEKKTAERARQALESQLKQFQTTAQLEQKRLEAGKRLLETSKRKLEAEKFQMSQQLFSQPTPPSTALKRPRVNTSTPSRASGCAEKGFQTDPYVPLAVENSDLIGKLLQSSSDLASLLHPPAVSSSTVPANVVPEFDVSEDRSILNTTTDLSQLIPQFSQWMPPASAIASGACNHPLASKPANSSPRPSKAITFHLTRAVASMLAGQESSLALVGPLLLHLQLDYDPSIVCSALHLLYALIQGSVRLRNRFRPPRHPTQRLCRISGPTPGITATLTNAQVVDDSASLSSELAAQDLPRSILHTLGKLLDDLAAKTDRSSFWSDMSMRVHTSIFSVVSCVVGMASLGAPSPAQTSSRGDNVPLMHDLPKPDQVDWIFQPLVAPLCNLVTEFLSKVSTSGTNGSSSSLPLDNHAFPGNAVMVVVDGANILSHLAAQPQLLPLLQSHLSKWWTQLLAATQPTASAQGWAVHMAVLQLMQAISTLYPSQSWYLHHPKAVDVLWEIVKRIWKFTQASRALDADASQACADHDQVLVVALNMLAVEALASKRSILGDVVKQHLVDEIRRTVKAKIESCARSERQWELVQRVLVRPFH